MRGVVVSGGENALGVVEKASDDVEANAAASCTRVFREPGGGAAPEPDLLAVVYGFRRRSVVSEGGVRSASAGLDFHEDEGVGGTSDQVDLDSPRADVASDDLIPSRFEMTCGALLPLAPEGSTSSGHGGIDLLSRMGRHALAGVGAG